MTQQFKFGDHDSIARQSTTQLADLLRLAIELNSPEYHVFIEFNGHVESLCIGVYPGGWARDKGRKEKDDWMDYLDTPQRGTKTTEIAIAAACQQAGTGGDWNNRAGNLWRVPVKYLYFEYQRWGKT